MSASFERVIADVAVNEFQIFKFRRPRDVVAQTDKLLFCVNAGDSDINAANVFEIIIGRKCQITFARTHINDVERRAVFEIRFVHEIGERFDKFVDLFPFVVLFVADLAAVGRDAERAEIKTVGIYKPLLFAVVRLCRFGVECRSGDVQTRFSFFADIELKIVFDGKKMSGEKIIAEYFVQKFYAFVKRIIFRRIARVIAIKKEKPRAAFCFDQAHHRFLQMLVRAFIIA